jgi:hypothetical protein
MKVDFLLKKLLDLLRPKLAKPKDWTLRLWLQKSCGCCLWSLYNPAGEPYDSLIHRPCDRLIQYYDPHVRRN